MSNLIALILIQIALCSAVTDKVITSWTQCTGKKGYNSQLSDVQKIQYSDNYVYISSTSIPGTYTVGGGGWADDPYVPVAQTFVIKLPRNPVVATTTTAIPLGTSGIWLNGVSIYNANDGKSYNNDGYWYRNAYFFEGYSFDNCSGHASAGSGTVKDGLYHHHTAPNCFYTDSSSSHSPLLGYALDGFPIYGKYGYTTATNSGSAIKELKSCYSAASYSSTSGARTKKGDGTTATSTGPSLTDTVALNTLTPTVMTAYSSGAFLNDYVFASSGSCDLDSHNGRFQVTPEYPNGIYCYIATSSYPYIFGPGNFYGQVASTDTLNTISESTTTYFSYDSSSSSSSSSSGRIINASFGFILALISFLC